MYTKLEKGEFTCETYLDLVDDLRSDEECHFLDQMNVSGMDLVVVELQQITLTPPSICQVRENPMRNQMTEIYRIGKERGVKIHRERDTP